MTLQDLYKVANDYTWITVVTGSTVFKPAYNGLITDIPVSLLDSYIKSLSIIDIDHLLITIV